MNRAIDHQDASGNAGAPLGVFLNGELLAVVPVEDTYGYDTCERFGGVGRGLEVLMTCMNHPSVAAVDCTDCAPPD